jgi:hypothetical protein
MITTYLPPRGRPGEGPGRVPAAWKTRVRLGALLSTGRPTHDSINHRVIARSVRYADFGTGSGSPDPLGQQGFGTIAEAAHRKDGAQIGAAEGQFWTSHDRRGVGARAHPAGSANFM